MPPRGWQDSTEAPSGSVVSSLAMSDGGFDYVVLDGGVIEATFHAMTILPGPQFANMQVTTGLSGFHFAIIRNGIISDEKCSRDQIFGGYVFIELERFHLLGGIPINSCWTALKVHPHVIEGPTCKLCIIDLRLPDSGYIIRHPKGAISPAVLDVCSGVGGWHIGGRPFLFRPEISIELDPEVARLAAVNHKSQVVKPQRFADASSSELATFFRSGVIINGDFGDCVSWENVASRGIHVVVASLPCPPWSNLTAAPGLNDPRGQLFKRFIHMMNIFRPVIIALENLPGLVKHDHWDCIRKEFESIGFVLCHLSVDPLSHVLPMSRDRISIIFCNRTHADEITTMKLPPTPLPKLKLEHNPRQEGVYHDIVPDILLEAVQITHEQKKLLGRPDMWPSYWKIHHPSSTPGEIALENRVISQRMTLPCAVAKYAQPEAISERLLIEKGLIMKLTSDSKGPRWFSPVELQAALGFPLSFMLSRQHALSFHVMGNTISPVHAAATIARIAIVYPKAVGKHTTIFDAILQIMSEIPRVPQCFVEWDEDFVWTSPADLMNPCPRSYIPPKKLTPIELALAHGSVNASAVSVAPTLIDCSLEPVVTSLTQKPSISPTPDDLLRRVLTPGISPVFEWSGEVSGLVNITQQGIDESLIPTLWITNREGFEPPCSHESNPDHTDDPNDVVFSVCDIFSPWQTLVNGNWDMTIGQIIRSACPSVEPYHCETILVDEQPMTWSAKPTCSTISIKLRKFVRRISLPGSHDSFVILCDPIDSVASVCKEHYSLKQHDGTPHLVAVHPLSCVDNDLHMIFERLSPDDSLAKIDIVHWSVVWAIEQVAHQPLSDSPIPISDDSDSNDRNDSEPQDRLTIEIAQPVLKKVAVIHPITGRFHEVSVPDTICIAQLLDFVEPSLPASINLVAEINAKRVNMNKPVLLVNQRDTIRFRHFSGPGGSGLQSSLKTELVGRGVPEEHAAQRVNAVMSSIGEEAVRDAFLTNDPWQQLKRSCSNRNIRLIQPAELKEHQKHQRAASRSSHSTHASSNESKGAKGKGKGRKGKRQNDPPMQLPNWDEVLLPDGFVGPADEPIEYITKEQVTRDAQGVCPMSVEEASAFMATITGSISEDPLSLLVVGHCFMPKEQEIIHMAIPATNRLNGEPLLIPATLVHLGDSLVYFTFQGPTTEVETIASVVIEVQIEAARCKFWSGIVKPLDIIVQGLPSLRSRDKLLAHWSWRWTDGKRGKSQPSEAVMLHGYVRIPDAEVNTLLAASGPNGISLWAKSPDKSNDPRFSHIAITAQSEDEVAALAQSTPNALGYVFQNGKWLIRCKREFYPEVRRQIVPQGIVLEATAINDHDSLFVLQAPTAQLSCKTQAIDQGLEAMGWKAKVVKSMGPSSWLIASSDEPPSAHVSLNGEIVAIRPYVSGKNPVSAFLAPIAQHHNLNSSNPWAKYVPINADPKVPSVGPTASRLEEIEKKVEKKLVGLLDTKMASLEAKIAAVDCQASQSAADCNKRLTQIQTEVSHATSSVSQLEQQINANHVQMLAQMREMFQSFNPTSDEGPKRRKSDPNQGQT